MIDIYHKIQTFNPELILIANLRWLVLKEKKTQKLQSSIVIAVASQDIANSINYYKVSIYGPKEKRELYISTRSSDQCSKCQGFRHHTTRCRETTKCSFCAGSDKTCLHICNTCQKVRKICSHIVIKCANCEGQHEANNLTCKSIRTIHRTTEVLSAKTAK